MLKCKLLFTAHHGTFTGCYPVWIQIIYCLLAGLVSFNAIYFIMGFYPHLFCLFVTLMESFVMSFCLSMKLLPVSHGIMQSCEFPKRFRNLFC